MNKKVLLLLGTGHAITDISQGAIPMVLAFLQPVLGLSQLQVGIVMLAFSITLGWLADQWGLPAVFKMMVLFPVIGLVIAVFLPGSRELSRRQGAGS